METIVRRYGQPRRGAGPEDQNAAWRHPRGGPLIAENSRYVNLTSAEMPFSGLGHQNLIFLHSDSLWSIHPSLTPRTASLYVRGTICSDEAVRVGTHPMTCFPWRPPPTLAAAHLFTTQTPGGMLGIEYVRGPAFRCKEIGGKYGPGFLASSPDQGKNAVATGRAERASPPPDG